MTRSFTCPYLTVVEVGQNELTLQLVRDRLHVVY
jgi:hypothetical protein